METKVKITMEPGRKYRGTASINEYGEISFVPEQKGTRPQNLSIIYRDENITLYESKHLFKVSIQVQKTSDTLSAIVSKLTDAVSLSLHYIHKKK